MKKSPAKVLKELGLINYDLRKKLTVGQAKYVKSLANKYTDIIKDPQYFQTKTVKRQEARKELRASGYPVINGRIIVPKSGGKVSIRGNRLIFENDQELREVFLVSNVNFLNQVEKARQEKPQRNVLWTVKVADNNPFNRAQYQRLDDLIRYLPTVVWHDEEDDEENDPDSPTTSEGKRKAKTYVSLVRITVKGPMQDKSRTKPNARKKDKKSRRV